MTKKQFGELRRGMVLYHVKNQNADLSPQRWRIVGKMQGSLKTGSAKWPIKHGLYAYDYLTPDNMDLLELNERAAARRRKEMAR